MNWIIKNFSLKVMFFMIYGLKFVGLEFRYIKYEVKILIFFK